MNISFRMIGAFFLLFTIEVASAEPLLVEGFESGDLSATNEDGFKWLGANRTTVVGRLTRTAVDGSVIEKPVESNWEPKEGSYSLRFNYPAGAAMSEQRFSLGKAYPEVWFRYWLRVPINYEHDDPKVAGNRKFFSIWMDEYSNKGNGPTVTWEFWRNKTGDGSNIAVNYTVGGYKGSGPHRQHQPFIKYPDDRGRWMQVVLRVKAASSAGANNGVIELWRRWEKESNFTKIHEILSANISIPSTGPSGWEKGYLMGWANAAYVNDTEWLLDEFVVSSSSLLDESSGSAPPVAPVLLAP